MPEPKQPDKDRIPRSLNTADEQPEEDKQPSMEQVVVNSMVTIAASLCECAEGINDICAALEIIKDIEVKRAANEGLLSPDEIKDLLSDDEDEEGETDEPQPGNP